MKKLLFTVICCSVCISFSVFAKESSEILCNSYETFNNLYQNATSEKVLLLDDYLTYEDGGTFAINWDLFPIDKEVIDNMSFEKLLSILPKNEKAEEEKKVLKEMAEQLSNFEKNSKNREKLEVVKIHPLSNYILYTEKNCSSDIKEKIQPLKQQVIEAEKKLFSKRTKGKKIHHKPLEYFTLTNQPIQPSEKFIYTYRAEYNPAVPAIRLRVLQVVPTGVLVQADGNQNQFLRWYGTAADKTIFVETTSNYVDKDLLHSGYYEYVGTKSYGSVVGNRTVHSFKEISNPFEGLLFYKGNE